ncbi:MAG: hypothetical protein Q9188_001113 [Gyalolechia gomerana]
MQSGARGLYQYALLNLAILHADFGCFSEAITAMQETIATARENHDMPCLNYSLSWLHQFGRKHPEEMTGIQKRGVLGSEKEALSFLKAKAKETNMWPLLSKTLLSEAKFILSNVSLDVRSLGLVAFRPCMADIAALRGIACLKLSRALLRQPISTSLKILANHMVVNG